MDVNARQTVPLNADTITSHIYEDGAACIELGTRYNAAQSVLIWVGKPPEANLGEEAAALRKLAQVASDLAGHLDRRAAAAEAEVTS